MNRLELVAIVCISVFGVPACVGALIGESCTDTSECPINSTCVKPMCETPSSDEKKCVCVTGFFPLQNKQGCQTVVDLHQTCDNFHVCRAGSYCGHDSKCQCKDGYQPCKDNVRCKPRLSGTSADGRTFMAMYGEACDDTVVCMDKFGFTECRAHKCRCRDGYRPRTETDQLLNPSMAEADCLPKTFSEEMCA
ncbi:adhesion G protein-coupled receptor E5-like [Liolophura sinensis]|uniref:adhesion G protein-coupled receptor E5-like n=1 Tax=Liolophura sinensis TaxID=3198878 RepID=UPI003158BEBE